MNRIILFTGLVYVLLGSLSVFSMSSVDQRQLLNKSEMCLRKSELDSALKYLSFAEVHYKNTEQDSLIALIANRKARIYLMKEERDSAFSILKANQVFIKNKFGERNELIAMCYDLLGDSYMSLSDAYAGVSHFRKSLDIRKTIYTENHPRIAFSYSNIARYYSFKIEKDSALYFAKIAYNSFLRNYESNLDIPYERIHMEYAYAYKIFYMRPDSLSQTLEEVRNLYLKTLNFTNKNYGHMSLASAAVYRSIGNTYTDILLGFRGNSDLKIYYFNQGIINYNKSIAITSTILQNKGSALSTLFFVKGLIYEYAFVCDSIKQSFDLYDKSIHSLIPTYNFTNILSDSEINNCKDKYELMTILFTKSSCYWKAYNYSKQTKYLEMALVTAKNMVPLWNSVIGEFESSYANRLITIYNGKVFNFLVDLAWSLYNLKKDSQYLYDIFYFSSQSKCSLQTRLLAKVSPGDNSPTINYIKLEDLQSVLPNDKSAYIEFFDTTMVIGVSKNSFVVERLNQKINQDALLKSYQYQLVNNNPNLYQQVAYLLFQTYFEPILNRLGNEFTHVIIANDGIISNVGVSGLITDTIDNGKDFRAFKYFGQRYSIQHTLGGNDLFKEVNTRKWRNSTIMGMVPNFASMSTLPFSKLLIEKMKKKVNGDYYVNNDGLKEIFLKSAPNHRVIQLSTHAEADMGELMKSKIYFSDKNLTNNFLTLDSIYKMKFNSQLAILSACETNVGRMEYGEGSVNFSRAFLYAGCQSTITTQWKVDDKATSSIILEFYNSLLKGLNLSQSLQQSQLLYLKNCNSSTEAHPYYWSSLVVTGSDSPVNLDRKNNSVIYGLAISTLLIWLTWFWIKRNKRKREFKT